MSSSMRGGLAVAICLLTIAGFTNRAFGQDPNYQLTVGDVSGLTGSAATTQVLLNSSAGGAIKGWSYGLCTDPALASVTDATTGATTATVNLGGPPEFESILIYPGGVTHGVVICFAGCDVLDPGAGHQLLSVDLDLVGPEGAVGVNCFCDSLGSPAIETILVDPIGAAIIPTQTCGSVEILDPPAAVSGLSCLPVLQTCSCDAQLSWSNPEAYDSINVYRNGTLVSTLAGGATSTAFTGESGLNEYCVEAIRDGLMSPLACCQVDCPAVSVPSTPVTGLDCTVDPGSCDSNVTWNNTSDYSEIRVTLDGLLIATLPGTNTSLVVSLPGTGSYDICVEATTVCDDPVAAECCTAECPVQFQRGDVNGDSSTNIADAVATLDYLFGSGSGVVDCLDSLDGNDDGGADIADAVYVLGYLFASGPAPASPFGSCGTDPTPDAIGCVAYPLCP